MRYRLFIFFILSSLFCEAQTVTTVAGSDMGFLDGPTDIACFNYPNSIAIDSLGNLFIADVQNHKIRKIELSTNMVSTYAGLGPGYKDGNTLNCKFNQPMSVCFDRNGDLLIADFINSVVRVISTPRKTVECIAGWRETFGFVDGFVRDSRFHNLTCVAQDPYGFTYVVDYENHAIRRVSPDDQVVTLAGNGSPGSEDGKGREARFNHPYGLALDKEGNIYVADEFNHRIRKIDKNGQVSTLGGSKAGDRDGKIGEALFNRPCSLVIDAQGTIYVADFGNQKVKKITSDGLVSTVAGSTLGYADGEGRKAKFNGPGGLTLDKDGNIYVADVYNNRIRKITLNVINPQVPVLSASRRSLSYNEVTELNVYGRLNSALYWKVYENNCSGEAIETTTRSKIVLHPRETTTYCVRGEGGGVKPGTCATITIKVDVPYWRTWWFITMAILVLVLIGYAVTLMQLRREQLKRKVLEFESQALRAQMNPHFIFNCLNSIQSFIINNEKNKATNYLAAFARLIRKTLYNSRSSFTSVESEVEVLKDYLELERMRFKDKFDYYLSVDPAINQEITFIPPMIIQPFVENALLHGVMHLKGKQGLIEISFQKKESVLLCVIKDNGIGRVAAESMKDSNAAQHKSYGSKISAERIKIFQQKNNAVHDIQLRDIIVDGKVVGTKVEIAIPFELDN